MKFGICASFQQVAALKTRPFDYLEESVQRFLIPERPQADFEALLHEARRVLSIPIETANVFLPGDLSLVETQDRIVDRPRLERYVKTALQRAEQVGVRLIVFGSGSARACPEGYDHADAVRQIGEHLASWCAWAREHGVTIVLEPLRYQEANTINTVAEGGALVASIAQSGAALLADTYHMGSNGEDPASIRAVAPYLAHVHVAEVEGRSAPGVHGEDASPYFSALHAIGYDRRISIECNWHDLATEIEPAFATLRAQWAAAN
jgi:sugar phosphate isomerase/epimerase